MFQTLLYQFHIYVKFFMYVTFIDTKFLIEKELYVQYPCILYCTDCMLVYKSRFMMSLDIYNIF